MRRILVAIEIILVIVAVGFAVAWVISPEKPYEPYIVLATVVATGLTDFGRRRNGAKAPPQAMTIKEQSEPSRVMTKEGGKQTLHPSQSASFFAERFAQAFPGVRSIKWYRDREAVGRLAVLLQDPLVFENGDAKTIPIWWWRDGNLHIPSFNILSRRVALLDTKELKIGRVAAVPSSSYFRCFVYLEAEAMKPCGAYEWNTEKIKQWVHDFGYAWEEYGLYKGKHVVSRAEYDDNAAKIRGKLVKFGPDIELRVRFITPYNLVIASRLSPINNAEFDGTLRLFMDRMLRGEAEIGELAAQIEALPKPRAWGD